MKIATAARAVAAALLGLLGPQNEHEPAALRRARA
ncbi:hypothetical protein ACVINU_007842 [Bradyrhizobium diazoefficiens]